MAVNRGKDFENNIRKQFEELMQTFVLRLYDVTMGYCGIDNPCDLIVFRNGALNLFECKAIHGNTLNFKSHIRENQWNKLLKYSEIECINAGILVWFIDNDATYFLDIRLLEMLKKSGRVSFNVKKDVENPNNSWIMKISGRKKKVFYEYDLDNFLFKLEWRDYV